jgi:endonuclease YncB( thermonuclease family)
LLNIDAPELAQPYGDKALLMCKELCLGDQVRVDWEDRDPQGNLLATIHEEDGFNVNLEMVKAGLAWSAPTHDRIFADLETEARKAKRGLWADRRPTPPWDYRKQHQKQQPPAGAIPSAARQTIGPLTSPFRW